MSDLRLPWSDIKKTYPDEWVVLVELDVDESIPQLRGGVVLSHGKSRKEALASAQIAPGRGWALRFTGRKSGTHLLLLKCAR